MENSNKLIRPVFNSDNINRSDALFKQIVDDYIEWEGNADAQLNRASYENDIIDCLKQFNKDGYALARYLDDKIQIQPDRRLVEILDDVHVVSRQLNDELVRQWVIDNQLKISETVIGKYVKYKQRFTSDSGYITTIKPTTYQVTVDKSPTTAGGWVIDYENIIFEV